MKHLIILVLATILSATLWSCQEDLPPANICVWPPCPVSNHEFVGVLLKDTTLGNIVSGSFIEVTHMEDTVLSHNGTKTVVLALYNNSQIDSIPNHSLVKGFLRQYFYIRETNDSAFYEIAVWACPVLEIVSPESGVSPLSE